MRERWKSRIKHLPRPLLFGLAALVILGLGATVAYVFLASDGEACVMGSTGESVECGAAGAISEREYRTQQTQATQRRQAAHAKAEVCKGKLGELITSLEDLNSRLAGGFQYAVYTHRIRDLQAMYEQVGYRRLDFGCLTEVGLPVESAINRYAKADAIWYRCASDPGCDTSKVEPKVRQHWRDASNSIADAKRGLKQLERPSAT
jgi:hypothetical protein